MGLTHITGKDWYRLATSLNEARKRELGELIPPNEDLLPEIRAAIGKDGGLVANLVPVFGEPIRRAFEMVRDVVSDKYGSEYRDQLWARINQTEDCP